MRKRKKIKKYRIFPAAFFIFTHFDTLMCAVRFLKTVVTDFFGIQFLRKFGLTKTPIVNVDNELDKKIPFVPEKIGVYFEFTSFWIRPLSMLIHRLGKKRAKPYIIEFLKKITEVYSSAGQIYKMCMTTTSRPRCYKKFYFSVIYFFDPHYLCVPSLHVSIVSLVWSFYRRLISQLDDFSEEEKKAYIDELYDGAIEITEAVLYIKQHSVNCIPAALYMMTFLMEPYFTPEDGIQFLKDLFAKTDIPVEVQKELKDYMYFIYERFLLVGISDYNWIAPVRSWLKEYALNTGHVLKEKKIK